MAQSKLEQMVPLLENHLECWKQFNYYANLARSKQFTAEDESQFLDVKSIIAQELESIMFSLQFVQPTKDDIHALLGAAPSLRVLSEMNEVSQRALENQWHQIFIAWQSNLGQLKVQLQQEKNRSRSFFSRLFGG
jgi:REP element-mobilizing transposase RayT